MILLNINGYAIWALLHHRFIKVTVLHQYCLISNARCYFNLTSVNFDVSDIFDAFFTFDICVNFDVLSLLTFLTFDVLTFDICVTFVVLTSCHF